MTITAPLSGDTFEAELEADESRVLMVYESSRITGKRTALHPLAAVLKIGWRIVETTPRSRR